jgi:hypothetical protein
MILISVIMLLVGGGIFPPILAMIIGAVAPDPTHPTPGAYTSIRWFPAVSSKIMDHTFTLCVFSWFALIPGAGLVEQSFHVDTTDLILILIARHLVRYY